LANGKNNNITYQKFYGQSFRTKIRDNMLMIENLDKIYGHPINEDYVFGKIIPHRYDYYIYLNDMEGVQKRDLRLHRILEGGGDTYKLHYGNKHIRITKNAIENKDTFGVYIAALID